MGAAIVQTSMGLAPRIPGGEDEESILFGIGNSAVDGKSQWYYVRSDEAHQDCATEECHFEYLDIHVATVVLVLGVYASTGLALTESAAGVENDRLTCHRFRSNEVAAVVERSLPCEHRFGSGPQGCRSGST